MLRALLVIIIIRLSGSLLVPRTYRYFVFLLASLRVYVSYVALASERWAACFAGFASLSLLRFLTAPGAYPEQSNCQQEFLVLHPSF